MEVVVDEEGRVRLPKELMKKLGLTSGSRLRASVKGGRIILTKLLEPEEYVRYVREVAEQVRRSKSGQLDPLKLKEMWGRSA